MPSRSQGKPRLGAALALATSGASVVIRAACTAVAIVQVFAEVLPLAILDVVAPVPSSPLPPQSTQLQSDPVTVAEWPLEALRDARSN